MTQDKIEQALERLVGYAKSTDDNIPFHHIDNINELEETIRATLKFAQEADPILKQIKEAGDKATQGEFTLSKNEDMPYIFLNNTHSVIARFDYSRKDRDFILLCANLRPQINKLYEKGE